jgi:hypothetical protein
LQVAVAAYRIRDCVFNECSKVHGVSEATVRRCAMKENWYVIFVKLLRERTTFSRGMDTILAEDVLNLEFELAEK